MLNIVITLKETKFQKYSFLLFAFVFFCVFPSKAEVKLFKKGVVVSKNQLASDAGASILRNGGNAVDAAIATTYALGVVEPNGSGIGGGGFALIYKASTKKMYAVDFRERAPLAINSFPYDFKDGPKAGGVPGTVRGLEYMRSTFGTKNRKELIQPSIKLASEGFPINKTLSDSIAIRKDALQRYPSSATIFLPEGKPPAEGYILKQHDLANTLNDIAEYGMEGFYEGPLANKLVRGIDESGGIMSMKDLQKYSVMLWEPLCGKYRNKFTVCSFPPPSSGGVCILEALNILENFPLNSLKIDSPERLKYVIEALKFSFSDRAYSLGDPRFSELPVERLTSKRYARLIAKRIELSKQATPSNQIFPSVSTNEKVQTTHFSVADKYGNIVVVTISLNGPLGSGFVIPGTGVLLNNTLDDFSLPGESNQYGLVGNKRNYPEPGKTPLSSMSPTIVFDSANKPFLALGSPGGPTIISAVLNVLLAKIDSSLPLDKAVEVGRVHHQWFPDLVYSEPSLIDEKLKNKLISDFGYNFPEDGKNIWKKFYWTVEAIELNRKTGQLIGVSDPRAEQGVAYE